MRKLFSVIILLCSAMLLSAQFQKSPEFDLGIGTTSKPGFTMNLSLKNINGWGFYFTSYGTGTSVPTGETGIDYRGIADRTRLVDSYTLDEKDEYGMTFGVLVNSYKLFNNFKRLNFILGGGYSKETIYEKDQYRHEFDYTEDEYSYYTAEMETNYSPSFDIGANINIAEVDYFVFGAETVYNTSLGISVRGFVGLKFRKD